MKWFLLALPTLLCYLAYSFIVMVVDVTLWSYSERAMLVFLSITFTFPAAGWISEMKK